MKTIILLLVVLMSCTKSEQDIDAQVFRDLMDGKNVIVLDVRTPEEFLAEKIPGAININMYDPKAPEQVGMLDKNKRYLVYCRTGRRSSHMTNLMIKLGYKAHNLLAGINGWKGKGYPVVR